MGAHAYRWLDTVLHVPLNETGVSLSVLTSVKSRSKWVYLPVPSRLPPGELDALIRRYGPLSAGCPALLLSYAGSRHVKGLYRLVFRYEGAL